MALAATGRRSVNSPMSDDNMSRWRATQCWWYGPETDVHTIEAHLRCEHLMNGADLRYMGRDELLAMHESVRAA